MSAGAPPEEILEKLHALLIEPFQRAGDPVYWSDFSLERLLREWDGLGSFELSGSDVLAWKGAEGRGALLASILRGEDRVRKEGRRLHVFLRSPRTLPVPGAPAEVAIDREATLEIAAAGERLSDPEVEARKQAVIAGAKELAGPPAAKILVAAVLPQQKKLLGIRTPIGVKLAGLRFSVRFLLASIQPPRPRCFVAGPTLREIPLPAPS